LKPNSQALLKSQEKTQQTGKSLPRDPHQNTSEKETREGIAKYVKQSHLPIGMEGPMGP
jgi:hypothetical protein